MDLLVVFFLLEVPLRKPDVQVMEEMGLILEDELGHNEEDARQRRCPTVD